MTIIIFLGLIRKGYKYKLRNLVTLVYNQAFHQPKRKMKTEKIFRTSIQTTNMYQIKKIYVVLGKKPSSPL